MPEPIFFSNSGQLLPRWLQAFPAARGLALGGKGPVLSPGLVWLRLPDGCEPALMIAEVRARVGAAAIVVLSDQPGDEEALACFAAAAKGYCNSHAQPELLLRVAQVVSQGGLWIGEALMQRLLQGTARIPLPTEAESPADWADLLTEREREVARAVAGGFSNKEIARRLGITERTVKAHTGAIFGKLGVRDRLQLSLLVHGRKAE